MQEEINKGEENYRAIDFYLFHYMDIFDLHKCRTQIHIYKKQFPSEKITANLLYMQSPLTKQTNT
jgi:hypothetical protein